MDPKDNAQVFSNRIELKEGQTTVKFYAVNDYGIKSDVITKTYNIQYSGPATPEITPSDTTISQSSKVMVTVTVIIIHLTERHLLQTAQSTASLLNFRQELRLLL